MFDPTGNLQNTQAYREAAQQQAPKQAKAPKPQRNATYDKLFGESQKKQEQPPTRRFRGSQEPQDGFTPTGDNDLGLIPNLSKQFTSGNKVELLADARVTPDDNRDDIFTQVDQMVRGAKESVQIEMFNLDKPEIVDLLAQQAKNGIKVQVITHPPDKASSAAKQEAIDKMRANGIEVLTYPANNRRLDHVKLLLVDGNKAIIGGMNWGGHSPHNHDFDVSIQGPAVDHLEREFKEDWIRSGGDVNKLPEITPTAAHPEGDAKVNVLTSGREVEEQTYGKSVEYAIRGAQKSIHMEMFTFTDKNIAKELIKAKDRGVDVKVIMNPLQINGFGVNEKAFRMLKNNGVPVKWYVCDKATQEKLHAKTFIIDGDQSIVGSANTSNAAYTQHREMGVEVQSQAVNNKLEEIFMNDWENKTANYPGYLRKPDTNAGG